MGRTINGEEEDYLLDLSKPYHNLLGIRKGDSRQNFYFGNNVSAMEEADIPCPYDRQGEEQPFGYTGYRFDDVSGTYFAQAREYQVGNGFTAEDLVKGNDVEQIWILLAKS